MNPRHLCAAIVACVGIVGCQGHENKNNFLSNSSAQGPTSNAKPSEASFSEQTSKTSCAAGLEGNFLDPGDPWIGWIKIQHQDGQWTVEEKGFPIYRVTGNWEKSQNNRDYIAHCQKQTLSVIFRSANEDIRGEFAVSYCPVSLFELETDPSIRGKAAFQKPCCFGVVIEERCPCFPR